MRVKTLFKVFVIAPALTALAVMILERLMLRKIDSVQKPPNWETPRWPKGHTSTVQTDDGAELVVEISGALSGPVIVLVHGLSADHHCFGPIAKGLIEEGCCVVGVNQRGHGGSTVGSAGFGPERQGLDLGEVLHAMNLQDVHLVGHSMGGIAAMSLLTMGPSSAGKRVASLTLLSTLADTSGKIRQFFLGLSNQAWYQRLIDHPVHGPALARFALFGRTPSLQMVNDALELGQRCPTPHRIDASLGLIQFDIRGLLTLIDLPTTVVCGVNDLLTTHSENQRIADLIPSAEMVTVTHAGHMFIWESPNQITEAILQNVDKVTS
tara:strand:- start:194 stop:1162 length:969 start_codon:yes stop_codon:yes gene_type:complete